MLLPRHVFPHLHNSVPFLIRKPLSSSFKALVPCSSLSVQFPCLSLCHLPILSKPTVSSFASMSPSSITSFQREGPVLMEATLILAILGIISSPVAASRFSKLSSAASNLNTLPSPSPHSTLSPEFLPPPSHPPPPSPPPPPIARPPVPLTAPPPVEDRAPRSPSGGSRRLVNSELESRECMKHYSQGRLCGDVPSHGGNNNDINAPAGVPNWYPDHVVVPSPAPATTAGGDAPSRVYQPERDNSTMAHTTMESATKFNQCVYTIVTTTSPIAGAGTTADVNAEFSNDDGESVLFVGLRSQARGPSFRRGATDTVTAVGDCVPSICRVHLSHDDSGPDPGWFVETVAVSVRLQTRVFRVFQWLSKDEPPYSLSTTVSSCAAAAR